MKQTLKKLSAFMMAMAISGALFAQVPQKFNYQGIARDTKGNPMAQQRMTLKLTVLPTSDATEGEYEEIQSVTTNEFGLYNLQIGNGTPVKGEMKTVKWETGNKYIKVAIDPKGGSDFVDAGTTQLLSVPYAIYADKAGMAKTTAASDRTGTVSTSASGTGTVNYLTKFTAANTIYNSQLFDNGTNVGIGTTTPSAKFHINQNTASVLELIRMQNLSATGAGRFTLYSDAASNYSTFTKYGSTYAGSYAGLTGLYPYGNLLAFGNNGVAAGDGLGRFLISTAGNAGISIFKGGTSKLKFHADFTTENVGIGGNAAPVSRVHLNNTDGTTMDLRLTNTTTGQTATDGMTITQSGVNTVLTNRENGYMAIGTNNAEQVRITAAGNVGVGTTAPDYKLDVVHGGLDGIRSKSTFGYSVLDVDAANGDAALRLLNSGNIRWGINTIGTNNKDLQLFQYGNGSVMTVDSATKNVSIGSSGAPSPSFKLSVDPDPASSIGGILVNDAVDDYSIYASKSGLFEAIYLSKTNTGTSTPVLTLSSASNSASALNIGSNGSGAYINANDGNGITVSSYHGTGIDGNAINAYSDSLTAGYFYSDGAGSALYNGVLRGEYTGTSIQDYVGVYGKSVPSTIDNYGVGVQGEGGYKGVQGTVSNPIALTVYGLSGSAFNNASAFGVYGNASSYTISGVGTKYGVYGSASGGLTNYAGYFSSGNVNVVNMLSKGGGTFKIDHPLDPENKILYHSFVESPDMMNIYNGNVTTDANGDAIVTMPTYFNALNTDFRYQLTTIGSFAQAMVSEEMNGNTFKVKTSQPNVKLSWQVTGIRQDAFANQNRVKVEVDKSASEKGKYIHPTAFGLPETRSIDFASEEEQRLRSEASKSLMEKQVAPNKNQFEKNRNADGSIKEVKQIPTSTHKIIKDDKSGSGFRK